MAGDAALFSRYLASEADLQGLTAEERAQRARLQRSIDAKPVRKGLARCFHCTDFRGGFHILASGLRPSEAYNEQQGRWNLKAGAFVTKLSPLDFGFPAKGWLERLLSNNYGKEVEDASGDPDGKWVRERGQVCLAVDIMERWLRNSHEDDIKYREEGRNVFFIPKKTFVDSKVEALPTDAVVYAFLSTLEEPPPELTALTKTRLGHALIGGDLFSVRWLLELGTPLEATQRRMLINLTQPEQIQDEDLNEAAHIQKILSQRQEQSFQLHLTPKHFQRVQRAMRSWAEPHAVGSAVAELDLLPGHISPEGASLLAEALEHNSYLRSLCLRWNEIGDQGASALGASALGEALKHNSRLQSLDLQGNSIGDQGASALGEALKHNSCLQSLDLDCNSIGDQGASALGEALRHNSCLQSLYLGANSVGDQGASALGEALKHNSCLRSLRLGFNRIGDQGTSALGEGLKHNSCLQSLHLCLNGIGDQGAATLEEALQCNGSLKILNLACNNISARGVSAMAGCRRPTLSIDFDLCVIA